MVQQLEIFQTRKLPSTSIAAYKQATTEMKAEHCAKIVKALTELGSANYERIADRAGLDRHQVGRRLSELERDQKVFKPGIQTKTRSGRKAFNYCLR